MSSSSPREVIHVSLGPEASLVTTHWMHLQGQRITNDDTEESGGCCAAAVTHSNASNTRSSNGSFVPRAILVDAATSPAFSLVCPSSGGGQQQQQQPPSSFLWSGTVQQLHLNQPYPSSSPIVVQDSFNHPPLSWNSNNLLPAVAAPVLSPFQQQQQQQPFTAASNRRDVDWDAELEEEPEDDNDYQTSSYYDRTPPQQQQQHSSSVSAAPVVGSSATPLHGNSPWRGHMMAQECCLPLSINSFWTSRDDAEDGASKEWLDPVIERLRRQLEECDACQGLALVTTTESSPSSNTLWDRLATQLLYYMNDECPGAKRWTLPVSTASTLSSAAVATTAGTTTTTNNLSVVDERLPLVQQQDENSHNTTMTATDPFAPSIVYPRHIRRGIAWHEHTEHSHLVLPLQLEPPPPQKEEDSLLYNLNSISCVAAALESLSLSYRLNPSNRSFLSMIGLQSYVYSGSWGGGDVPFGTAQPRLSLHEWVHLHKPGSGNQWNNVVEMDTILHSKTAASGETNLLWPKIRAGTSIERRLMQQDPRMQQKRSSSSTVTTIGQWLQPRLNDDTQNDGLLSCVSHEYGTHFSNGVGKGKQQPSKSIPNYRSLHHHYCLSSASVMTPTTTATSTMNSRQQQPPAPQLADYTITFMESMGVGFRPEQCTATVLLLNPSHHPHDFVASSSSLAVLGNSTRSYPLLNEIANSFKTGLSARYNSWFRRDVSLGRIPETEDCHDALEACYNRRDAYTPPNGSGLLDDDDDNNDFES